MSTTTPTSPPPAAPAAATSEPAPAPAPAGAGEGGTGITFEAIAVISLVLAFASAIVAVFALGLAARSIDEHRATPAGGAGGGTVAVSLEEFAINPAPLTVTAGGSLSVSNDGTTTHDLTVEDQDLATPVLDAGGTADLDVSSLEPGTYTVFCSIPGHRESGMETEITVG